MSKAAFKKVDKALDRIANLIESGELDQIVLTGAEAMLEEVKAQTPVKTGKLRDSLYIDTSGTGSIRPAPGRQSKLSAENVYCVISTDVFYAWFVEYGTAHSAAYPFMRPAYDNAARPIADTIRSMSVDLITSAFMGG